jgi:hypothetical protein
METVRNMDRMETVKISRNLETDIRMKLGAMVIKEVEDPTLSRQSARRWR